MPNDLLTDEPNDAGISVERDGNCVKLSLLNFEGVPIAATITVPKLATREGIRKFFHILAANEDVYLALMEEHLESNPDLVRPKKSKAKPVSATTKLRHGTLKAQVK